MVNGEFDTIRNMKIPKSESKTMKIKDSLSSGVVESSASTDISRMLRLGEDSVCEFKSMRIPGKRVVSPDGKEIADDIASAANAAGATFLFGVDDKTHEVDGIPEDKLGIAETWVRDICNDSIKPAVPAIIRKAIVRDSVGEERCVLRVDVPKSLFVHEGPHGYFYRIGSAKRKMPPEMLARLFQQRSQTRLICFDEQVVVNASIADLSKSLYNRFRTRYSDLDDEAYLRKLHFIAKDEGGEYMPTVAGLLMSCEYPERFLPSAFIQAVAYRGTERTADQQLDARDFCGTLDKQVIGAIDFVNRNMRIFAVKNPARIDIPQFSLAAVFEAVVNAVVHRDYSIQGAKIRLHMFSDRLEIFSPGSLPNSLGIDELSERQFSRNELICAMMSRCKVERFADDVGRLYMMDKRGEGIPIILDKSERLAAKKPEYKVLGESELKLTLFSSPGDDHEALLQIAKVNGIGVESPSKDQVTPQTTKLAPNETMSGTLNPESGTLNGKEGINEGLNEKIIDNEGINKGLNEKINGNEGIKTVIENNPGIRVPQLSVILGKSRQSVERYVAALRLQGIIEYRGSKKTGGYYAIGATD